MSLKLNVGLQKKVGLPDYGSLGASCHVEFEVDGSLIQHDLETFHQQVRNAFVACQQAVSDQLARQQGGTANGHGHGNGHASNGGATHGHTNGNGNGLSNGNGHPQNGSRTNVRLATASQARAIRAIAGRQRLDLNQLLGDRFGISRPEDLSISDASSLIDELKAPANGSAR